MRIVIFATILILTLTGCSPVNDTPSRISSKSFGQTPDGRDVTLFTLINGVGSSIEIMNLAALLFL